MRDLIDQLRRQARWQGQAAKHTPEWRAADEIERLRGRIERLRAAGRYVALALGGASDGSGDAWSRAEVRKLFEYVCQQCPELDPRIPPPTGGRDP